MPTKRSTVRSRSRAIRLTPKTRAVLNRIVARAKRGIVADVKAGIVPRSVRTVVGLGSYVDQNMYFLDADGNFDRDVDAMQVDLGRDGVDSQPMYDFLALAQDRVQVWMKTGALKRIPVARKATAKRGKVANPSRETPYAVGIQIGFGNAEEFADAFDRGDAPSDYYDEHDGRADYIRESAENLSMESDESLFYANAGLSSDDPERRPAIEEDRFEKGVRVGINRYLAANSPKRNPSRR